MQSVINKGDEAGKRGKVVRRPASKQCWSELSCLIIDHAA